MSGEAADTVATVGLGRPLPSKASLWLRLFPRMVKSASTHCMAAVWSGLALRANTRVNLLARLPRSRAGPGSVSPNYLTGGISYQGDHSDQASQFGEPLSLSQFHAW